MKKSPHNGSPAISKDRRHLHLLWGWVGYAVVFILTERLIPAERCTPVHMWLDDIIPFCRWFLIPYVFWYVLIVFSLGYFLARDVESFKGLQRYFITVQALASAVYILFPTRQDLRPAALMGQDLLSRGVELLYRVDTNTGVCPSVHVALSLGMASAWKKARGVSRLWKLVVWMSAVLICLSTLFLKQHSAVDFFAALPVCLLAEWVAYRSPLAGRGSSC